MQPNDFVLIHGGGSGVGTASVQLVRLAGGIPIVTAGTKEKIDKCIELGAKAGFNYKEGEFAAKVMSVTGGKISQLNLCNVLRFFQRRYLVFRKGS